MTEPKYRGLIYIRPTLKCPECGDTSLAKEDVIFLHDEIKKGAHLYEADLADEMTGLSLKCLSCGHEFEVSGVDVRLNEDRILEY